MDAQFVVLPSVVIASLSPCSPRFLRLKGARECKITVLHLPAQRLWPVPIQERR